jgi:hypothetical protein
MAIFQPITNSFEIVGGVPPRNTLLIPHSPKIKALLKNATHWQFLYTIFDLQSLY